MSTTLSYYYCRYAQIIKNGRKENERSINWYTTRARFHLSFLEYNENDLNWLFKYMLGNIN